MPKLNHLVAKITIAGGPHPMEEINFHVKRFKKYGYTWAATKWGKHDMVQFGKSKLYMISFLEDEDEWLEGTIVDFSAGPPKSQKIAAFYNQHLSGMTSWWRLENVSKAQGNFGVLGLLSRKSGDLINKTFFSGTQTTFVYAYKSE